MSRAWIAFYVGAMPQLEPTTLLRVGIAYRGARVPYPTPPGYPGSAEPAAGQD